MQDAYALFWETFRFFPSSARPQKSKPAAHPLMWVHALVIGFFLSEFLIDILYDWRVCVANLTQNACGFPLSRSDVTSLRLIVPFALFIVIVWLFERWQQRVPAIFKKILYPSRPEQYILSKVESDKEVLQKRYFSFLEGYQDALLARGKLRKFRLYYIFAWVLLALCLFSILPLTEILKPFSSDNLLNALVLLGRIFVCLFAVTFSCLVAIGSWAMGTTGVYLTKLCSNFTLLLHPNHPDSSNGFRWLGLFCLDLALPLLLLDLTLAISFFLASIFPYIGADILLPIKIISPTFVILLTLVATYAFFRPLWGIHVQMAEMLERESNIYAMNIEQWQQILQVALVAGEYDEAKKAKEQLDIAKQLPNPDDYSTWPLPFVRIQIISFLSPILIAALAPFLQQILHTLFHISI
ncbi:hypothetical protein [Dictyobacter arantiisoli]|uniref:Uncharacterized protein n=1 Tax=Dictyobacter arantiisoli TaxID=2014874 RepID=A0A5A5TC20_9CHLR|nr:hypothetical protein [Dictyobacter arantiisoli]GCF08696.1 hypothetical protein KDI_22600 [Dictyobacter arantiisoli]